MFKKYYSILYIWSNIPVLNNRRFAVNVRSPEDSQLHIPHHENLKSHSDFTSTVLGNKMCTNLSCVRPSC